MTNQYKDNYQTKRHIETQDNIDNVIFNMLVEMYQIYSATSKEVLPEFSWDIEKISNVREEIEKQLDLPKIY
ncbi:hypothetical protein [Bacillus pumilus]|uniref:hypothetical protein n=1 Tax=Bacillus pumilus TaxID=1408 RepID=UPI002110EFD3|nr:hypothetical protein [Bacillus pumilus]UUD44605.1 hypothetical protein NPA43_18905 [Bacillus pumilus]